MAATLPRTSASTKARAIQPCLMGVERPEA